MTPRLALFAKAPERGRVKTRLAAELGEDAALAVYRALLEYTRQVVAAWRGGVTLHAEGAEAAWLDSPLRTLPRRPQCRGGLGERLAHGLAWELDQGGPVVAIGADCPGLDHAALAEVGELLSHHPVVFGPSDDGGYWCLGVADPAALAPCCDPTLPWSRPQLLARSETACARAGLGTARAATRDDVDTLADLRRAEAAGFGWR